MFYLQDDMLGFSFQMINGIMTNVIC